jgi:hypothetical protein
LQHVECTAEQLQTPVDTLCLTIVFVHSAKLIELWFMAPPSFLLMCSCGCSTPARFGYGWMDYAAVAQPAGYDRICT